MALDTFNPYLFVSSGEQSNKFLTPTYADGIAKFQAQREQSLTGLTVRIDPIQEGSGDPSPSNIRPISGRTGLTVTRANKNLSPNMAGQASTTSNGITFTYNDDGSVTLNGTATGSAFSRAVSGISSNIRFPFGTYKKPVINLGDNQYIGLYVQYMESSSSWVTVEGGGLARDPFFIDRDIPIAIRVGVTSGTTVSNFRFEPYVYPDSVSDLTWVSPVKREYLVTWESIAGTVYGGTLDVVSGVLTVTDAQIASYAGETLPGEWISDRDVYVAGTTPTTGAQVVYKLATPQTYRLTGAEVRTLAGYNQVYSDAGPVNDIKF